MSGLSSRFAISSATIASAGGHALAVSTDVTDAQAMEGLYAAAEAS